MSLPAVTVETPEPDPSGEAGWDSLKASGRPVDLFLILKEGKAWRIAHNGHRAGTYVSAEAAIAYACRLAQESAGLGYPSAVFKAAAPSVFKGFFPHGSLPKTG